MIKKRGDEQLQTPINSKMVEMGRIREKRRGRRGSVRERRKKTNRHVFFLPMQ